MGSSEEQQPVRSKSSPQDAESLDAPESPAASSESAGAGVQATSRFKMDAQHAPLRFWLLPVGEDDAWVVTDEHDAAKMAGRLDEAPAQVFSVRVNSDEQPHAIAYAREYSKSKYREKLHESFFSVSTRLLISFGWLLAAVAGLRIPGAIKLIDELLLVSGLGFLGFTLVRYGVPLLSWYNRGATAPAKFSGAKWKHSPIMDRLEAALKLRRSLTPEERGQSPDAELLDANAYRKLIAEGVTSVAELSAIGKAIEASMRLNEPDRKTADIAKECRLDPEAVIFYRDLASIANVIGIEQHLP